MLGSVSYRLHRIGQPKLIPTRFQNSWLDIYAIPILDYNSSIDGRSVKGHYPLAGLTPVGKEKAKSGFTVGGRVGFGGRYIFQKPEQRNYINYGISTSAEYSLVHSLGIYHQNSYFCSVNPFFNWWYLDLCANISKKEREITEDNTYYASATFLKYLKSFSENYHEFRFGWNHLINEDLKGSTDYSQDQFLIGIENTHNINLTSSLNLLWGLDSSNRPNHLPLTKHQLSGTLGTIFGGKLLSLSGSVSNSYTVQYYRNDRTDLAWSISITYPIWRNFTTTVGYSSTDSTDDFFDVQEPFYQLSISPIVF